MNKWYIEKGDQGDVVLSTRIRLARNLEEYPFPVRLDVAGKNSVNSLVINLGGKKQSSYVKLLSQSTELFSTVSGLQNQIATLERQRKAD